MYTQLLEKGASRHSRYGKQQTMKKKNHCTYKLQSKLQGKNTKPDMEKEKLTLRTMQTNVATDKQEKSEYLEIASKGLDT
jgi:hypothetical protein